MLFSNFTEKARIAISEAHDAAAEMGQVCAVIACGIMKRAANAHK